jgi:hypothetical protein
MINSRVLKQNCSALFAIIVLSLPSLYTLAASSKQLVNFAPVTFAPRIWYGVLLLTGFVAHLLSGRLQRTLVYLLGVTVVTVLGHIGVYVLTVAYLRGMWMARMTFYSMLWQLLILPAVAALLLGAGMLCAMLLLRLTNRSSVGRN